jgi:ribosome-binding protein aMBF1 (putative translation factor)
MKTFGEVIAEARVKAGLTQREMAARIKTEKGNPISART